MSRTGLPAGLTASPFVKRRREFLLLLAGSGLASLAACAAPAPTATQAPTAPAPAASSKQPAPTTAPTSQPAPTAASKPAATAAPAKPTYTPVDIVMASAYTAAGSVPWRMGIELGFFREFGINLEARVVSGSANVIAALAGGEAQVAEGGAPSPLAAIEKGQGFRILSGSYTKPAYYIFSRPEINSLADLEGKVVGANRPGSLTYSLTATILRNAGVDLDKLQIISIGSSNDIYAAVVAGKIDAGIGDVAHVINADRDGVKPLVKTWEAIPNYLSACIYCMADRLQSQRDVMVRVLAGFARSYRYSRTPEAKDNWIRISSEQLSLDPRQAEFEYEWMRENGGVAYDLEAPPEQIEYMQQQNIEAGTQDKIVPYEQVVDPTVARDALALL